MAVAGGNLYAALRADLITDLPAGASGFDCMSASVPFYGMVFYGYASLCGTPLNTVDDWDEALLDCLEYGVAPSWQLTGCSNRPCGRPRCPFCIIPPPTRWRSGPYPCLNGTRKRAARLDGRRDAQPSAGKRRRPGGVQRERAAGYHRSGQPTVFEGISLPPGEWRILE